MRRFAAPLALLLACSAAEKKDQEPLGALPSATTTAEPLWIPFSLRAGHAVERDAREQHLTELRQITFDARSGGAVWSPDGRKLLIEADRGGNACGAVYEIDLGSGERRRVSPSGGWARSAAYLGQRILFAHSPDAAPPCGLYWGGGLRLWPTEIRGVEAVLLKGGYDADVSAHDGRRIVFTSSRDGDLELYAAGPEGESPRRLTNAPGYDGGAAIAPNGASIAWHAEHLGPADVEAHRQAVAAGTIAPSTLALFLAGEGGQHPRAIVTRGRYNVTPAFLPDSRRILFASDWDAVSSGLGAPAPQAVSSARGAPGPHADGQIAERGFDLYLVDPDAPLTATGMPAIERVTLHERFDGEPRFSPDGRYLAFTSGRGSRAGGTDVFVARWVE